MVQTLKVKNQLTPQKAESLKGKFLDETYFDTLITTDTDAYDVHGNLLFRFRKNAIPIDVLKSGVDAFKDAIAKTTGRGVAAGGYINALKKDGTKSNFDTSLPVDSGNVGYMDARPGSGTNAVCRKTAFARDYFEKFKKGIPFVEFVDKLYAQLCPTYHKKQLAIAKGTNVNYRIANTSFTTVTVNRNFQTAVHKDAGDFPEGFGNLIIYREGDYKGAYFCLPEYRIAIDLHNTDILFVDVHRWHGNTPFLETSEDYLRIAFVMYYREYMYKCKSPKDELFNIKMNQTGFLKL
jgi:hypothetical protein